MGIAVVTFKKLYLLAARRARAFAAIADLTHQRADMLLALMHRALSQRELVETLCVSAPVVSRMVTALEKLGLVERRRSDSDKRVKLVDITKDGMARLNVYFDGLMPDTGEETVLSGSESTMLMMHGDELRRQGIVLELPLGDQGSFLRPFQQCIWREDPWDYGFGF